MTNRQAFLICSLLVALLTITCPINADEVTESYRIARGGRLYDNWITTLKLRKFSKETHPAYPPTGADKGLVTWRCSKCHGWDYQGKEGVFTNNLRAWTGRDPADVVVLLRNTTHRYTPELIPEDAANDLALFITRGLIEPERHIDPDSGRSRGNAVQGAPYFQNICATCHGLDGRKLNFGSDRDPSYIGTEAHEHPFEVLHKIRHGQPGQDMISLLLLPTEVAADILAYEQTLPIH